MHQMQNVKTYRPCAGIVLVNRSGRVFLGQRHDTIAGAQPGMTGRQAALAASDAGWQMPQGGIEAGEDIIAAARRELSEETSVVSTELIGVSPNWYCYDFPPDIAAKMRPFDGQRQKWVALRFVGADSEINILSPRGGHASEFRSWRWALPDEALSLAIDFKQDVYRHVMADFADIWKNAIRKA